jgi:hypothetical protein
MKLVANVIAFFLASCALAFADDVPQFQVDPFWPKPLPNNWILGQVAGIATDKYDRVWVVQRPLSLTPRERAAEQNPPEAKCCRAAPPVLLFDGSGNLLRSWGGPGQGYQWPENEHGIFIDDNDFVWLAGNGKKDGQLLKFTMDGKFVLQIGKQGDGNDSNATDRLGSPADLAVDVAAKEVFAADGYANRGVVVFDYETGAYKRHWGAYGERPSDEKQPKYDPAKSPSRQFANPVHCIRIGKDELVYQQPHAGVPQGRHLRVGARLREGNARQRHRLRHGVLARRHAEAHLHDRRHERRSPRCRSRLKRGYHPLRRPGRQAGQFTALHNIAVDRQGNIYTAEVQTGQRIQKFRRIDAQN